MHTGDGIERAEVSADASLTPVGGEGGSVLQALGSKAEERAKRRKKKKDSYAKYLEGPTWKKIRRRALSRDKHKCLACGAKAEHVHHVRYPKNLGEEKMEWLYSLCAPCHNEIHRRTGKGTTLRKATDSVLGLPPRRKKQTKDQKRKEVDLTRLKIKTGGPRLGDASTKRKGRSKSLAAQNAYMHEIQVRARANRERRRNGDRA